MFDNDTVFALSTPVGGAITVMRITGPSTRALLSSIFTGKVEHRRVSFGRITDGSGGIVDEVNAVFFEAPNSYTGEDMAEIFCHGSYAVAVKLSELIVSTGLARPAAPGEFTKRAYLAGKMDLTEAEAVMDLVSASAERSRRAALAQLTGRLSERIGVIYDEIKLSCAELVNYEDDDSEEAELDFEGLSKRLNGLAGDIRELSEGGMRARILREGARVAVVGSPNVGKSSLLNALLMRDRAIVTPIPGTTRDTLEESVSVCGVPVTLIDTAGIRESSDEIERLGVSRSLSAADEADLVLMLFDGSRPVNGGDIEILQLMRDKNIIAVITKSDLEQVVSPDDGALRGLDPVRVSALTGDGLDALRRKIASALLPESADEPLVTNSRHISALSDASEALLRAGGLVKAGDTDAAVFEMRCALERTASILGRQDPDEELIDSVFSNFCVGK